MPSFQTIITNAQDLLGEVSGPGVQLYAEDRMFKDAVRAFNMLFTKYGWEQYKSWFRLELNGTSGLVTTNDLANVRDFHDFLGVYRDGEPGQMSILPSRLNPYTLGTGTRPQFYTSLPVTHASYATKRLLFYPSTAEGFVNIQARVYPATETVPFTPDSIVYMDEDLLTYATAFMGLAMEDLNGNAAETMKTLMEVRFKDIMASLSSHPTSTGSGAAPSGDWTQVP